MHSVWLCSRNDLVSNVAVILAGLPALTQSQWPDVLVGLGIAGSCIPRMAFFPFDISCACLIRPSRREFRLWVAGERLNAGN
jgi:hypothetical protein